VQPEPQPSVGYMEQQAQPPLNTDDDGRLHAVAELPPLFGRLFPHFRVRPCRPMQATESLCLCCCWLGCSPSQCRAAQPSDSASPTLLPAVLQHCPV
jgi:hypothetical protein